MVMQRFLTYFKPWLIAVSKGGALIVAYRLLDQIRARMQRPPLDLSDVVTAATIALLTLALFCAARAWAEWCGFKMHRFRGWGSNYRLIFAGQRNHRKLETWRP